MDSFEERRERLLLDMMRMDSCSEMGEGPGWVGVVQMGGREGGGLVTC